MKYLILITIIGLGIYGIANATDNLVDWSNGQPSVIEDGTNTATGSYDWSLGQPTLRLEFEPTPTPTPTPITGSMLIKSGTAHAKSGGLLIK